jgi:voltage-gated potassium channel
MPAPHPSPLRRRLFEIIFEADTPSGRAFDLALLATILASVGVILVKSVPGIAGDTDEALVTVEWGFTLLFTLEYLVRLWVVARPRKYALSFFGVVDLLAILPTYLSLLLPGAQVLLVIRMVRLLRVFHVLNLKGYEGAAENLVAALRGTRFPLTVFLTALVVIAVFLGSLMYLVEGPDSGFTSIPVGIYWAAVTLTTLGYGDLVPVTSLGRGVTTVIVALSYWVLAVPVAIVSVELSRAVRRREGSAGEGRSEGENGGCPGCGAAGHASDARYCRRCGSHLGGAGPSRGERAPP